MSRIERIVYGLGALTPGLSLALFFVFAVGWAENGSALARVAPWVIVAVVAVAFTGFFMALHHVTSRADLSDQARERWKVWLMRFGPLALPVFWWRLVKPH
jgi:hypothetical protein